MARTEYSTPLTTIYENAIASVSNGYARDGARIVREYNIPIQTLRMLPRYGLIELIKRAEQLSHSNLSYEERKLRIQSWTGITPRESQAKFGRSTCFDRLNKIADSATVYDRFCGIILTGSYADTWKEPRDDSDLDIFLILTGQGNSQDKNKLAWPFFGEIEKIHPNTSITVAYAQKYSEMLKSVQKVTAKVAEPFRNIYLYNWSNPPVDDLILASSSHRGMRSFGSRLLQTEIPDLIQGLPPAYPEIPLYCNPPTSQEWELMKSKGYQPPNLVDLIEQKL